MQRLVRHLTQRRLLVPSFWSTFRILGWIILTLAGASFVIPDREIDLTANQYNQAASTPFVQTVSADRGDQRGFAARDVAGFRIAWTAGSSIQSINPDRYTFVPIEVQQHIRTLNNQPAFVDMYFLSGMRLFDEYGAVLEALSSSPDMLVVTLNPLWVLNDLAIQGWDNLDGHTLGNTLLRPSTWNLSASLAGPSDLAWVTLARYFNVVNDRYQWGTSLARRVEGTTLLKIGETPETEPTELQRIAAMQIPVEFWTLYAPSVAPNSPLDVRQLALFERELGSMSSFNESVLDEMFRAIRDSGVPTYVYVAPVDPTAIADPKIDQALQIVEQRIASIGARYETRSLVVESRTAIRFLEPFEFNDIVHLGEVGPFASYLANEICSVAMINEIEGDCE